MGGVEDGQPPSKRLRLSCAGSSSVSSGVRAEEPVAAGSLRDLMARPRQCQGEEEVIGSRGIIKKLEFVRLIAGALYALGYERSGASLEEESGVPLHSSAIKLLMQHVLDGDWDECATILQDICLEDETLMKLAKFLILEQKFFELLDSGKTMDALTTLRTEISPLQIKTNRVHELSICILHHPLMSQNGTAHKDSVKPRSRTEVLFELQKLLPPKIMVPARRLEYLVEQALNLQRETCLFHNSSDFDMSLYADHHCGRDNIPRYTLQVLQDHKDEVWFLQFSHDGKYLASASNDRSTIIWEVSVDGEVVFKHRLCGHQKPVSQIAWSPDDQQILTCGTEETVWRWDVFSGECLQVYEKAGYLAISCAWSPDGESVFAGFSDKSLCMWDLNGKELECWKGQKTVKISDLAVTLDGKQIISICRETAILLLDRETKVEKLIEEDQAITSFSLSNDGKFLLVNLINEEIHLWTIDGDIKLVAKYNGHKRSRFLVRSCFGGLEQSFIASGSEDSQVYIWGRSSGQLVDILPGHSGVVNCVSWNPVDPHMLATASDDRTIRIWGLGGANMRRRVCQSNGTHHSNSNGTHHSL